MRRPAPIALIGFVLLLGWAGIPPDADSVPPVQAIQASRIYLEDGDLLQDGWVILRGGRIEAIGKDLPMPEGARIYSLKETGHLTPGLIDPSSMAGVIAPSSWAEHADEVIPHMRNWDAIDLEAKTFERLAARGVTTVYVTPDPASVIGCRGAIVKTGGPASLRVVRKTADVKANMGPEGWRRGAYNRGPRGEVNFLTRRPTTRMGMAWVFRNAFFDALAYEKARKAVGPERPEKDPALETLLKVLKGEIPLRIQAREDIDIWSAIRMAKEFGLKFVLEEGTEAYRCIPELKEYAVPVVFGPIFVDPTGARSQSSEQLRPCLNTAGLLDQAGIPFALTAGDLDGEGALPHQACYAIRGGLTFEKALAATTSAPAKMLDISDRVGAIRPGLDADLVLWTGKPFSPSSKPALVLIGGREVYRDEKLETLKQTGEDK